jgi:hypothetical protein
MTAARPKVLFVYLSYSQQTRGLIEAAPSRNEDGTSE